MHILGISLGSPNGNSEILLKAALQSATSTSPIVTASLISLHTLSLPSAPLAKPNSSPASHLDDRPFLLTSILDADALIISSPIYTRQPPGIWKTFTDTAMGPFIDAVFVANAIEIKKTGREFVPGWTPDQRVLKPRVVGLIAQGGAITSEWGTLALPGLQQSVFSLHAKVVDQVLIRGQGFPGR
jgi:multimeric flavodoxin WrbA